MRFAGPIVLFALSLGGCSSCEGEPVPFGLDAGAPPRATAVEPTGAPDPSDARPAMVVRALPEGTTHAEVEGASLDVTGESLRALAAWDLEGDGDRDAIAVTSGPSPRVLVALRDGASLATPAAIATAAPLGEGCTVDRADVRVESVAIVVAELDATCPPDELGSTRALHAFAIRPGARPRALERFVLRAVDPGDRLRVRTEDRDSDGVSDLLVDVTVAVPGIETPADVTLAFLDRPAGLARDAGEPEQRIAALAQEARGQLRRHRERARAQVSRALALHEAICRESARPRLEVGGVAGVACGRSAAAGRALAILVQASATEDPLRALEALDRLASPHVQVREADATAARAAIEAITDTTLAVREGPVARAPSERTPRLSALAFVDEDHVLARGEGARIVDLAAGTEQPAPERGSLDLADPSGARRLVAIERRCEGTVVVVGAVGAVADVVDRQTTALLAPRRAPPGGPCPDLTPALRADADGWIALGWAPQGVLAARGTELRVVPLDLEGRAAGAPTLLDSSAIVPAPIAAGHATSDVRAYATVHPQGIVLVTLDGDRRRTLLRPSGWITPEGATIDVAISPSMRRIAWIAGGRLRWIERP